MVKPVNFYCTGPVSTVYLTDLVHTKLAPIVVNDERLLSQLRFPDMSSDIKLRTLKVNFKFGKP